MTIRRLRYASDKRKFKAVSSAHSREDPERDSFPKPWPISDGSMNNDAIPSGSQEEFDDGVSEITAATLNEMAIRLAVDPKYSRRNNLERKREERASPLQIPVETGDVHDAQGDVFENMERNDDWMREFQTRDCLDVKRTSSYEMTQTTHERNTVSGKFNYPHHNYDPPAIITPPETPTKTQFSKSSLNGIRMDYDTSYESDSMDVLARLTTLKRLVEQRRSDWGREGDLHGNYIDELLMDDDYGEI